MVIAAELEALAAQKALDALEENNSLAVAAAFQEIVDANHSNRLHRWVRQQDLFDLLGADIGAVVHDDLLLS